MLLKFDTMPYSNPHSLVTHTRWARLSFLGKQITEKFMKNTSSLPLKKHPPFLKQPTLNLTFRNTHFSWREGQGGGCKNYDFVFYVATYCIKMHKTQILLNHDKMLSFLHSCSYFIRDYKKGRSLPTSAKKKRKKKDT